MKSALTVRLSNLALYIALSGWVILAIYVFTSIEREGLSFQIIRDFISTEEQGIRFRALMLFGPLITSVLGYLLNESAKAERTMLENEEKFEKLTEKSLVGVYLIKDGVFKYVNPKMSEIFGYSVDELIGRMGPRDLVLPEDWPLVRENIRKRVEFEVESANYEFRCVRKDGAVIDVNAFGARTPYEGGQAVLGNLIDITKRKRGEEALVAANRALATLGACNQALVHAVEENDLLEDVCRIIVERGGYRLSWVGFAEEDEARTVRPVAHCGAEESYLASAGITWADTESGRGPTGTAIRTGEISVCRDILSDPKYAPWREKAKERGFQSSAAFPLHADAKVFGALNIYSAEPDAFSGEELTLLDGLAKDLSYGIMSLRNRKERELADERIKRQLQRLAALRKIDMAITSSFDFRMTIEVFLRELVAQLEVDAASVLLMNPHTHMLEHAASIGFRGRDIERSALKLGESFPGRAALEREPIILLELEETTTEFIRKFLVEDEEFKVFFWIPLIIKGQVKGVLEVFHRTPIEPELEWLQFMETLAGQAAIAIDDAAMFVDLQKSRDELALAYDRTIEGWAKALDYRDKETEGHSQRVTEMTVRIAREIGMEEEELAHVRRGALLHDIGKLGVPDAILFKPGKLDDEEWKVMKRHPALAYELLSPINYLRPSLDIPYCHHEKWDGSGYPRGLKEEQIPLAARVFAVVDVWDALSSDRPYRAAWPRDKVEEYLRENAGSHFDPEVLETFLKIEW